jgi:phenylpropionate dioxygenase-like ring-hydroxylating dioxygenase large terminal subunit
MGATEIEMSTITHAGPAFVAENRPPVFSTATPDVYRFPFPAFPNGWFPVALSHQIRAEELVAVHRLGKDLIVYRTADGIAKVMGAYCPHMGAHLGYGGKVIGDNVRCPFHHWQFGGDGRCTHAFNASKTPDAGLDTFPTTERNGAIYIWHDEKGRAPSWEIPLVPETASEDYRLVEGGIYEFRSHPQEAFENQPDILHLITLHDYKIKSGSWDCDELSTSLLLEIGGHNVVDSPYRGLVNVKSFGPSLNYSRFEDDVPAAALFMYTPVSPGIVYNPVMYWIHKNVPDEIALPWAKFITDIYVMDIPIWETKQYNSNPQMTDADGPIAKMRRWYQRWYN